MESIAQAWSLVADRWDEVMAQASEGDMANATPCADWSCQELVDHAMFWQGQGAAVFGAELPEGAGWDAVKPAMAAALADPAALEGTADAMGGMPKQAVAGLVTTDLLVHTWDLARSLGVDASLPEPAVQAAMMGLQRLPEEMLRSETMFGPAVEVPEDASAQDKLIGFVGRTP